MTMTDKIPETLPVLQECANTLCTEENVELTVRCNEVRATLTHFIELSEIINAKLCAEPVARWFLDLRVLKQWQDALSDMRNLK